MNDEPEQQSLTTNGWADSRLFASMQDRIEKVAYSSLSAAAIFLMLISPLAHSEPNYAYIIIRAVAVQEKMDQPHWILIHKVGSIRDTHYPASGPILRVRAGTHRIYHIDFSRDRTSSLGTFHFSDPFELNVEAGKIYIFGTLELSNDTRRAMDFSIDIDFDLLRAACEAEPDILESLPVVNIHTGTEFKVSCADEKD